VTNQFVRLETRQGVQDSTEGLASQTDLESLVIERLRDIYDPEISLNIYDLGLIYKLDISGEGDVTVDMTLTSPACPVAESLPNQVSKSIRMIAGVSSVSVNLVWEPPWSRECMSDEAKLSLGLL